MNCTFSTNGQFHLICQIYVRKFVVFSFPLMAIAISHFILHIANLSLLFFCQEFVDFTDLLNNQLFVSLIFPIVFVSVLLIFALSFLLLRVFLGM